MRDKFDSKFNGIVHGKESDEDYLKKNNNLDSSATIDQCSISAISNLFGGMIYKFGELEYTQPEEK